MESKENEIKDKKKLDKNKKIIITIIVIGILCVMFTIGLFGKKSMWQSNIDENKMVEIAKQNIRNKFNNVANIRFHYGAEIEYKDKDYNDKYYFMFYRVSVTITNYYNVKTDYYCTVKIIFYKETMEYDASDVRIQKINS